MATNKKPNRHKSIGLPPKIMAKLEHDFRVENLKARKAGIEYGILATKIVMYTLMLKNKQSSNDFIIDRTELIEAINRSKELLLEGKPISEFVDEFNTSITEGLKISKDDLVAMDPSLQQYF